MIQPIHSDTRETANLNGGGGGSLGKLVDSGLIPDVRFLILSLKFSKEFLRASKLLSYFLLVVCTSFISMCPSY